MNTLFSAVTAWVGGSRSTRWKPWPHRLNIEPMGIGKAVLIHDYLSHHSYWAQGRSLDVVVKSIEHSLCFGVFSATQQVGFARVVTDYATFSWLCDLYILNSHRGRGLGKWLVECIVTHPELQEVGQSLLATKDAHKLYRRYGGFQALPVPEKWMVRRNKE